MDLSPFRGMYNICMPVIGVDILDVSHVCIMQIQCEPVI